MRYTIPIHYRPSFSIEHFFYAFAGGVAVVFAISSWAMWDELKTLRVDMSQKTLQSAKSELRIAVFTILDRATFITQNLSEDEDVLEMLAEPVEYARWTARKMRDLVFAYGAISGMDLYDRNGNNLNDVSSGLSGMPQQVLNNDARRLLVREKNQDFLYVFLPVNNSTAAPRIIGYVGLKLDFLQALRNTQRYRYLDSKSLVLRESIEDQPTADQIVERMSFTILEDPDAQALERLTANSFLRLAFILIAIWISAYFLTIYLVGRPLQRFSKYLDFMRSKRSPRLLEDGALGLYSIRELENVRKSFNDYQTKLHDLNASVEVMNKELITLTHHDALSGVCNRHAFESNWEKLLNGTRPRSDQVAFLVFNCDDFKAINDTYGHPAGDYVIRGIAESLSTALRQRDLLYRMYGDEFATLLMEVDSTNAQDIAQKCLEEIGRYDFSVHGITQSIRVSAAIAYTGSGNDEEFNLLRKQAEIAMFYAKRMVENKISTYSPEMEKNTLFVSNPGINSVYAAITHPEHLVMHYQKMVRLENSEIAYYEALVRIKEGDRLIMPLDIFPVVESKHLDVEFDLAIFKCIQVDLERGAIPKGVGVSINVSGPSIINATILDKLLSLAAFIPEYPLLLEVTETVLITHISQASSNLSTLRKAGFRIALDDFGSGYSSFRYLANMPVDIVKFDISLIRVLGGKSAQSTVIENLVHLILDAGYELVAEGIENQAILDKVLRLGFAYGQGEVFEMPKELATA